MGRHAVRGVLSAWLGLIVLRAFGNAGATGQLGTLVTDVNALVTRALSPGVPAIPDRRGPQTHPAPDGYLAPPG